MHISSRSWYSWTSLQNLDNEFSEAPSSLVRKRPSTTKWTPNNNNKSKYFTTILSWINKNNFTVEIYTIPLSIIAYTVHKQLTHRFNSIFYARGLLDNFVMILYSFTRMETNCGSMNQILVATNYEMQLDSIRTNYENKTFREIPHSLSLQYI